MKQFEMKQGHLDLLQRMYVNWGDGYDGAPEINCKRPYGNSSPFWDVAEILGYPTDEWKGFDVPEDVLRECRKMHEETETALQIVLCTMTFRTGTYEMTDEYDQRSWVLRG